MRGLAVLAVLAAVGLTACTGGSDDDRATAPDGETPSLSPVPTAQACKDGTYTWSGIQRTDRLTGVSAAVEVSGELIDKSQKLELPERRVFTPQISVTAQGPALPSAEILFSLGKKTGEIDSTARTLAEDDGGGYLFTEVGNHPVALDGTSITPNAAGTFVSYEGVVEVRGNFRYTCADGSVVQGQAQSWTDSVGGVFQCDKPLDADAFRRLAAQRSCKPNDAALRSS
ncbi:hypothetical protein ACVNF4_11190 [Streptomyces sp. S6]